MRKILNKNLLRLAFLNLIFWFSLGYAMQTKVLPISWVLVASGCFAFLTMLEVSQVSEKLMRWMSREKREGKGSEKEILFTMGGHDFVQSDGNFEAFEIAKRIGENSEASFRKPRTITFRYVSRPAARESLSDLEDLNALLKEMGQARGSRLLLTQFKAKSESMATLADVCEGFAPLSSAICENVAVRTDLIPAGEISGRRLPRWIFEALDRDYEEVVVYAAEDRLPVWRSSLEPSAAAVMDSVRMIKPEAKAEEEYL